MNKPWIDGSKELIIHAAEHLDGQTDFDKRIAMISIDNAVEISIKTFLSLPKRISKIQGPSRKELQDAENSFPTYLDLLEKYGTDKLIDISLEDIEWYHRLRNELYHNGNGITIDKSKVEAYFEIARNLFDNLFDEKLVNDSNYAYTTNFGKFMSNWTKLEKLLRTKLPPKGDNYAYYWKRDFLKAMDPSLAADFTEVSDFRNRVVHGVIDATSQDFIPMINKTQFMINKLS